MHSLKLLLLLWSFSWSSIRTSAGISRGVNQSLYEPPRIDLKYTGAKLTLYVRLCRYSVTDAAGLLYVNMTRYCYCTDEFDEASCSYPGPTLEMHSDTSIEVLVVNQLKGVNSTTQYHNQYKDMDTTNMHVHGLHVDPRVDDVLIRIEPNNYSQLYPYDIKFHYPGTHWYHAHHHGSVTYQVNAGLHGAILMTSNDPLEVDLSKYKENVLLFNWFYVIPALYCNNNTRGGVNNSICNGTAPDADSPNPPRFIIQEAAPGIPSADYAMCEIYCKFPTNQLAASGYIYDVETRIPFNPSIFGPPPDGKHQIDQNLLLFFTNGQISPIIKNLTVGIYHRLRLINSLSNWFLQFKFPDECDWHLIATDGIYIDSDKYRNYNLNNTTHSNELFMSSGGRTDLMVRCHSPGTYPIYSSNSTKGVNYTFRVPPGRILFSIAVNSQINGKSYNGTDSLPMHYATKPTGSYIEDLSNLTRDVGLQKECDCNYNTTDTEDCHISLSFRGGANVNGKPFGYNKSSTYPYLSDAVTIISKNKSYEFIVENNGHVYHQHINPFQIPSNTFIANGFVALPGTWWDTLGNNYQNIPMRFWTRDYDGLVIVHCHLLQHEDVGMMGFYDITNNSYCPFHQNVELQQTNDGPWGEWGEAKYCNPGEYAIGFKIKVEPLSNGLFDDNTAANAIRLLCASKADNLPIYNEINSINEGPWGKWSDDILCPSGSFITGFDQKVESDQGDFADDTALSSIKVKCSDGDIKQDENNNFDGSFTGNYKQCPSNSYVCGFRQKIETQQFPGVDDTALNAVNMYCCSDTLI